MLDTILYCLNLLHKAGNSALHHAAQNKKDLVNIVEILLGRGFSINKTDKVGFSYNTLKHVIMQTHAYIQLGRTALHLASRSGNREIVKILLSNRANVSALTEVSTCIFEITFNFLL